MCPWKTYNHLLSLRFPSNIQFVYIYELVMTEYSQFVIIMDSKYSKVGINTTACRLFSKWCQTFGGRCRSLLIISVSKIAISTSTTFHDDVIKWKHFPRCWPFVRGIHRSPVNSSHKGQWRGALMFSLICVWINSWVNNREAGDLRRHRTHYDVIVMHDECQAISILFSLANYTSICFHNAEYRAPIISNI